MYQVSEQMQSKFESFLSIQQVQQVLDFIEKVLGAIKKVFAWLGILILPEDGEYDYPTEAPTDDPVIGA